MMLDKYQCVINDDITYKSIATNLKVGGSLLFAWTDERGTMYNILMALEPDIIIGNIKNLQSGIKPSDLFVSIIHLGSFGFKIKKEKTLVGNYIAEKLNTGTGATADKLAELINNILWELYTTK